MAGPPFEVGDAAVRFVLDGDTVTVHTTTIKGVRQQGDKWFVVDSIGMEHEVTEQGESSALVPMDDFLGHELRVKGEGFHVVEEGRLRDPFEMQEPEIGGEGIGH